MDWHENNSRSFEILGSYFRHGLHELGSVCYGPGTAAQFPEYGMLGTKPQSMVVEGLRGEGEPTVSPMHDTPSPSGLETHMEQPQPMQAPEPMHAPDMPAPSGLDAHMEQARAMHPPEPLPEPAPEPSAPSMERD